MKYRYEIYHDMIYRFPQGSMAGQLFTNDGWKYTENAMLLAWSGDGLDISEEKALEHVLNYDKSTKEVFYEVEAKGN